MPGSGDGVENDTAVEDTDDGTNDFFLTSQQVIEVAGRLASLVPEQNSDVLEQWLCVRYFETAARNSRKGRKGSKKSALPQQIVLKIASCREFADAFFGLELDEQHPFFVVFKANNAGRRWPRSRGGNGWPGQSFWQRFWELTDAKPAHSLFKYQRSSGQVKIGTKRGPAGVKAFKEAVLSWKDGEALLSVSDLAEWFTRREAWPEPPDDVEVVARLIENIWIEDDEHELFDPESQALLTAAKAPKPS